MGVMVVVPALAGGQQGHPPVVPGIIARGESAAAPQVRYRVDQPGRVEANDDPEADTLQQKRNTTEGEKQERQHQHGNPMIVVQPEIEAVLGQIGRVLGQQRGITQFALANQKPADVSPPALTITHICCRAGASKSCE
jgi:hypothetical protein